MVHAAQPDCHGHRAVQGDLSTVHSEHAPWGIINSQTGKLGEREQLLREDRSCGTSVDEVESTGRVTLVSDCRLRQLGQGQVLDQLHTSPSSSSRWTSSSNRSRCNRRIRTKEQLATSGSPVKWYWYSTEQYKFLIESDTFIQETAAYIPQYGKTVHVL